MNKDQWKEVFLACVERSSNRNEFKILFDAMIPNSVKESEKPTYSYLIHYGCWIFNTLEHVKEN